MTILDTTSNETLKKAYVCPSLEIYISEEEDGLLNGSLEVDVEDEGDGDDNDDKELNPSLSKKRFGDNIFLIEDDFDY